MARQRPSGNTTRLKSLDVMGGDPRIESVEDERGSGDGLWAYTMHGWCNGDIGCHILHELTARELLRAYRDVRPCDCGDCKAAWPLGPQGETT